MQNEEPRERLQEIERSLPPDPAGPAALSFLTYRLHEPLIHYLQLAAEVVSRRIGRPEFQAALFAAGRVMTLNGLRANVKEVIFRENGFAPENKEQYRRGLNAFRVALNAGHRNVFAAYTPKFREMDLPVELVLCQTGGGAVLRTVNRFALAPEDEISIQKKIQRARTNYERFQFFEEGETDPSSHETIFRAATALDELDIQPRVSVWNDREQGRTVASLSIGDTEPLAEPANIPGEYALCSPLAFRKIFEP